MLYESVARQPCEIAEQFEVHHCQQRRPHPLPGSFEGYVLALCIPDE